MKKFIEIMMHDINVENFTNDEVILFGVVVPLAFVALCILVG